MAERLPGFYAITAPLTDVSDRQPLLEQNACQDWLAIFRRLLDSGLDLIQLRAKALNPEQLETLARHCQGLAEKRGVRLILNGPPALAESSGMAGVHLTGKALSELERRPLSCQYLVGASCHSPRELHKAVRTGADFACLSPVRPVLGYENAEHLGFGTFEKWVSDCEIPVYGLGGLVQGDLDKIVEVGGQGVAGISAFWR